MGRAGEWDGGIFLPFVPSFSTALGYFCFFFFSAFYTLISLCSIGPFLEHQCLLEISVRSYRIFIPKLYLVKNLAFLITKIELY